MQDGDMLRLLKYGVHTQDPAGCRGAPGGSQGWTAAPTIFLRSCSVFSHPAQPHREITTTAPWPSAGDCSQALVVLIRCCQWIDMVDGAPSTVSVVVVRGLGECRHRSRDSRHSCLPLGRRQPHVNALGPWVALVLLAIGSCASAADPCPRVNPGPVPPAEVAALGAIYNATKGDAWFQNSGWTSGTDPCAGQWFGVFCEGTNHVTQL